MKNNRLNEGYILVYTIIILFILLILGFSLLPLTVTEYKSTQTFSKYHRAYYLAEAAMEEGVAHLDSDWNYSGSSGTWLSNDIGDYKIDVLDDGENQKKIIASGSTDNSIRKIEAIIHKDVIVYKLSQLKEYVLYSQDDVEIDELGLIQAEGEETGIIGIDGDFKFNQVKDSDGEAILKVTGQIILPDINKIDSSIYPSNFSEYNEDLDDYTDFELSTYISWLEWKYPDKIIKLEAEDANDDIFISDKELQNILNNEGMVSLENDSIFIIDGYERVTIRNVHFKGLVIINGYSELLLQYGTYIEGVLIIEGNTTLPPDERIIQIEDNVGNIDGNLIALNGFKQKGSWRMKINYSPDIIDYITSYLPEKYEQPITPHSVNVIKWKEI